MANKKQDKPIVIFIRGNDWFIDYILFSDNNYPTMEVEMDEFTLQVMQDVKSNIEKQLDRFKNSFEWVEE